MIGTAFLKNPAAGSVVDEKSQLVFAVFRVRKGKLYGPIKA